MWSVRGQSGSWRLAYAKTTVLLQAKRTATEADLDAWVLCTPEAHGLIPSPEVQEDFLSVVLADAWLATGRDTLVSLAFKPPGSGSARYMLPEAQEKPVRATYAMVCANALVRHPRSADPPDDMAFEFTGPPPPYFLLPVDSVVLRVRAVTPDDVRNNNAMVAQDESLREDLVAAARYIIDQPMLVWKCPGNQYVRTYRVTLRSVFDPHIGAATLTWQDTDQPTREFALAVELRGGPTLVTYTDRAASPHPWRVPGDLEPKCAEGFRSQLTDDLVYHTPRNREAWVSFRPQNSDQTYSLGLVEDGKPLTLVDWSVHPWSALPAVTTTVTDMTARPALVKGTWSVEGVRANAQHNRDMWEAMMDVWGGGSVQAQPLSSTYWDWLMPILKSMNTNRVGMGFFRMAWFDVVAAVEFPSSLGDHSLRCKTTTVWFHGTKNAKAVLEAGGLDVAKASVSGHYGRGVYLADNARYSAHYANPDNSFGQALVQRWTDVLTQHGLMPNLNRSPYTSKLEPAVIFLVQVCAGGVEYAQGAVNPHQQSAMLGLNNAIDGWYAKDQPATAILARFPSLRVLYAPERGTVPREAIPVSSTEWLPSPSLPMYTTDPNQGADFLVTYNNADQRIVGMLLFHVQVQDRGGIM